MLKKQLVFSLLAVSFAMTTLFADNAMDSANQQLDQVIQKAEADVKTQYDNATRRDVVPMWSDKLQLETAIRQLELKKILVNNFKNTQSLNNPIIRNKLFEILNKDLILQSDLAELQNLVNQEKEKLNAQPVNTPSPSPAPTMLP